MTIEFKFIETAKNGHIRKEIIIKNVPNTVQLKELVEHFVHSTNQCPSVEPVYENIVALLDSIKEIPKKEDREIKETLSEPLESFEDIEPPKHTEKEKSHDQRPRAVSLIGSERTLSNSFAEKLEEAKKGFSEKQKVYSKVNCEVCNHSDRTEVIIGFRWTKCPGCGNRLFNEKAASEWHQPDWDNNTYLAQELYETPKERYEKRQLEEESAL